jgi:hypothetical protein
MLKNMAKVGCLKNKKLNPTHEEFKGRFKLSNSCFHPPQNASSHPLNSYRLRSYVIYSEGEYGSSVFKKKEKVSGTRVLRSTSGPTKETVIEE